MGKPQRAKKVFRVSVSIPQGEGEKNFPSRDRWSRERIIKTQSREKMPEGLFGTSRDKNCALFQPWVSFFRSGETLEKPRGGKF